MFTCWQLLHLRCFTPKPHGTGVSTWRRRIGQTDKTLRRGIQLHQGTCLRIAIPRYSKHRYHHSHALVECRASLFSFLIPSGLMLATIVAHSQLAEAAFAKAKDAVGVAQCKRLSGKLLFEVYTPTCQRLLHFTSRFACRNYSTVLHVQVAKWRESAAQKRGRKWHACALFHHVQTNQ